VWQRKKKRTNKKLKSFLFTEMAIIKVQKNTISNEFVFKVKYLTTKTGFFG
jgi:hypothetical protein